MEQKHTPGPWYAVPNSSFIDIATAPGCYSGKTIADTCSSGYSFDNGDCIYGETTVANAKLIAQRLNYWKPAFVPAVTCLTQGTSRRKGR
ncbi:hypothetical protein KQ096_002514 [Salmonella enterica]|nr:hypothetical protein [Salmonella enterica]